MEVEKRKHGPWPVKPFIACAPVGNLAIVKICSCS